jgi:hypothetical protein
VGCRSLPHVVVEQAVVRAIHYTTIARILAAANLQPHCSRYWKTTTTDECFTTKAARILWRNKRVGCLYERDTAWLCLDEKPNLHVFPQLGQKRRNLINTLGLIVSVVVTAANTDDRQGLMELLTHQLVPEMKRLLKIRVDGSYDTHSLRDWMCGVKQTQN